MTQITITTRRMVHALSKRLVLAIAFSAGLCLVPTARAQVLYGSLTGNVTDNSGAALSGAQVTAVNTQTGDSNVQKSDSAGIYRFPALLPGTYTVTITAQGFSPLVLTVP